MASHPHTHTHTHTPAANHHCHPITTTNPCSCCCYSTCCNPPPPDPLLHPLNPQIHHYHPPPPQPYHHHHHSPYLNPPYHPQIFHHQRQQAPHYPPPNHQKNQDLFQFHPYHHHQDQTRPNVSCILRRVAALESSLLLLPHFSADSASSFSLRATAARTIQTHFRAFLVHRSRTLRQLKELASIKSTLNALKASISDNTHLDSQAVYRRAMDLLLKLDFIQGGDPMIRHGKRSISRDLIRFLEFIDVVSVKRNRVSSIALHNVRLGGTGNKSRVFYSGQKIGAANFVDFAGDERELEKQRNRSEKIRGISRVCKEEEDEGGIEIGNHRISINGMMGSSHNRNGVLVKRHGGDQAKVKKTVSFAENGNVSRVSITTQEPNSSDDGSGSIDDERELVDTLCREVQEIGGFSKGSENDDEEACTEHGESPETNKFEFRGPYVNDDGEFAFLSPLPVKMESRADLVKNRKVVRIAN